MLAGCGFTVEKSSYRNVFLFPPIVMYRFARRMLKKHDRPEDVASDVYPPSKVVNSLLLSVSMLENLFQRLVHFPFGTSVFMTARRS